MAEYRLFIKASAAKEIEAVGTKTDRSRIVERIQAIGADPRGAGSETLAGYADRYRVRQGKYRIVYLTDNRCIELIIFKVGHRKDAYR